MIGKPTGISKFEDCGQESNALMVVPVELDERAEMNALAVAPAERNPVAVEPVNALRWCWPSWTRSW